MATLYFRHGVMSCGKTTDLLQKVYNYKKKGLQILLLKPAIDTKGDKNVVSRIGAKREVDALVSKNDSIREILSSHTRPVCILIDEAEFLTPIQVDELYSITKEDDIPVIAYGLRCDFRMQGFPGATRLLQLADDIEELKTVCEEPGCLQKATQNMRLNRGVPVFDGEQVAIDGTENNSYKVLCGKHYLMKRIEYSGKTKK